MKSEKNFKISFEEMSLKGKEIIAQQSEISLGKALEQVQLLKEHSKVGQSSKKSARFLKLWAKQSGLWLNSLPAGCNYLTRGGESDVYLSANKFNVIKVNNAIYYATWMEYFNSIVIHNLLFLNTAYSLLGFTEKNESLCVILQQTFIQGGQADLSHIKDMLTFNGFTNTKRQDYYNKEFGLLLEDMHDENVIAKRDVLFFIDTVFYVMENK